MKKEEQKMPKIYSAFGVDEETSAEIVKFLAKFTSEKKANENYYFSDDIEGLLKSDRFESEGEKLLAIYLLGRFHQRYLSHTSDIAIALGL